MANPKEYLRAQWMARPLHPEGGVGREKEIFSGFKSAFGHLGANTKN